MNIIGTVVGFTYCLTFNNSFLFSVLTLAIMKVFGTDIYIDLSGFVCLMTGIVVIILTFITFWVEEYMGEAKKDVAYWIMFTIFGGINGIGVIMGFFEEDVPFKYDDNDDIEDNIEKEQKNSKNNLFI